MFNSCISLCSTAVLFVVLFTYSLTCCAATTLYLTRHYEKESLPSNPPLSPKGQARAQQLEKVLQSTDIAAIYSTEYLRCVQTATPLARLKGLTLNYYQPTELVELASALRKNQINALVVGHSNTTPELIRLLGGPVFSIKEEDYGTLFEITLDAGTTTVTLHSVQLP
ncbi:histidine phosphatase family protein [Alteromonas aestuariivivens]|uniref:Histidine phosphatase family protein n=1 Tax=Alteromonas aestuariivivens TaxID=1938339 RepID=A0A3D8MFC6_9ALTE|nr:phosphoglycerate mutase family protein [Alteromonas aestuariivivens]RDV28898.1 histidine phosphatase family protein [Alteromonas aestuariivivens]